MLLTFWCYCRSNSPGFPAAHFCSHHKCSNYCSGKILTIPQVESLLNDDNFLQVTFQTLFITDVVNRKRRTASQPGRQLITFLLITNLTLWIVYTFEFQKLEASPIQLSVYGLTTWAVILRITLPLSIFYRFYSAVTFAEVWKNSYKQSTPLQIMA